MLALKRRLPTDFLRLLRLTAVLFITQLLLQFIRFEKSIHKIGQADIPINSTLLLQLGGFFLASVLLYLLFAIYCYWVAKYTNNIRQKISYPTGAWAILCWLETTLLACTLNQYYFPLSIFSFSPNLPTNSIFLTLLGLLVITHISLLVVATINFCRNYYPKIIIVIATLLIISSIITMALPKNVPSPTTTAKHPNIIIIGVDSLRPDHVSAINPTANPTPNIDRILNQSIKFDNAYTPQARTFPAWMSILTGNYPKTTGARFNLIEYNPDDYQYNLPNQLKRYGYKSLYAIDETRFSNISPQLGFDQIVQPAVGLSDFIINTIGDNILNNLVVNSPIGAWLFPFTHMNRAAYTTYYPETFIRAISRKLKSFGTRPLLLAVHFELSHWPFSYAGYNNTFDPFDFTPNNLYPHYKAMIALVDKQIGELILELQQLNLLDNSIVILLSDHGEGFELPYDRITTLPEFVPSISVTKPQMRFTTQYQSRSHGTDILSPSQYRVLLSWRLINNQSKHIKTAVSLVDITPTILDILQISSSKMDGKSLQPLFNHTASTIKRPVFIETGLSQQLVALSHPKYMHGTLADLSKFYKLTSNARLYLNPIYLPDLVTNKQRAIIDGDWLLAYYPNALQPPTWILVNLITHQWTLDLQSTFAKTANVSQLKQQFMEFYHDEVYPEDGTG